MSQSGGRTALVVTPRLAPATLVRQARRDRTSEVFVTVAHPHANTAGTWVAQSSEGESQRGRLDQGANLRGDASWRIQLVLDDGQGPAPWAMWEIGAQAPVCESHLRAQDGVAWRHALNELRGCLHRLPVLPDPILNEASSRRANELAASHSVAHRLSPLEDAPDQRLRHDGIRAARLGENIVRAASLELAFQRLSQSPAHQAIRMDPQLDHVGIGIAYDNDQWYVVELFGRHVSLASP
ncbi:MAG: hypothetical protein Q8Q09_12630 [Deltaproteobacteria bacterium]|nr:hypothetical protein [Deltaproteobacteria bacterium]